MHDFVPYLIPLFRQWIINYMIIIFSISSHMLSVAGDADAAVEGRI